MVDIPTMRGSLCLKLSLLSVLFVSVLAQGQPLPKIALREVYPGVTLASPVGMEEPPDESGRFFIVQQDGAIMVVPKVPDGKPAREFFNIVDRKPHTSVEDGLLD